MTNVVVVRVESHTDRTFDRSDRLLVNGEEKFRVHSLCECPEDAIIGRDLISCSDISNFLENFLREHQGKKVKFEYDEMEEE